MQCTTFLYRYDMKQAEVLRLLDRGSFPCCRSECLDSMNLFLFFRCIKLVYKDYSECVSKVGVYIPSQNLNLIFTSASLR